MPELRIHCPPEKNITPIKETKDIPEKEDDFLEFCRDVFMPKHGNSVFIKFQIKTKYKLSEIRTNTYEPLKEQNIHIKQTFLPTGRNCTIGWLTKSSPLLSNK